MEYQNFDLEISRVERGRFQARVLNSPGGEATAVFRLPFQKFELKAMLLELAGSVRTARGLELDSPGANVAKNFGGRLFDAVFGGPLHSCFTRSTEIADARGQGLRIRLRVMAGELVDIPWEFLYRRDRRMFLALGGNTPIVRYMEIPARIPALRVALPLRILAVAPRVAGLAELDSGKELRDLRGALSDLATKGMVHVESLAKGSLPVLQAALRDRPFHVFHFIGHGAFDDQAQGGSLAFENDLGHRHQVRGEALGALLNNHPTIRLAVLNSCEGAATSQHDPFAGVAQSLLQQGLPAVVGMQFEISDAAALVFAREFYSALGCGYPIDRALVEARTAVFTRHKGMEWGTPVLYMRSPDGVLFDLGETRREPLSPENDGPSKEPDERRYPATKTTEIGQRLGEKPPRVPDLEPPPTPWRIIAAAAVLVLAVILGILFKGRPGGGKGAVVGPVEQTGTVEIVVERERGETLADVGVKIATSPEGEVVYRAIIKGGDGIARSPELPEGQYNLTVSKPGKESFEELTRIYAGRPTPMSFAFGTEETRDKKIGPEYVEPRKVVQRPFPPAARARAAPGELPAPVSTESVSPVREIAFEFPGKWVMEHASDDTYSYFATPLKADRSVAGRRVLIQEVSARAGGVVLTSPTGAEFDTEIYFGVPPALPTSGQKTRVPFEFPSPPTAAAWLKLALFSKRDGAPEAARTFKWGYSAETSQPTAEPKLTRLKEAQFTEFDVGERGLTAQLRGWTGWGSTCRFVLVDPVVVVKLQVR